MYPDDFLGAIMEGLSYVEKTRAPAVAATTTREDVLDAMEARLSHMLRVLIATPTSTSFAFFRDGEAPPGFD
mgnify:CR=1 FL=1